MWCRFAKILRKLTPQQATQNFHAAVSRGMSFLHDSLGITVIHGDLKTSNVLLQHHGTYYTAQIADFGLQALARAAGFDNCSV